VLRVPSSSTQRGVAIHELLLLLGALLACGGGLSKKLDQPESPDASFIYGYIDMKDAPTGVDWVEFEQVAPQVEKRFLGMRVDDGIFYNEQFPRGSFVLSGFGSTSGWSNSRTT
jgi:hypothetical protein